VAAGQPTSLLTVAGYMAGRASRNQAQLGIVAQMLANLLVVGF